MLTRFSVVIYTQAWNHCCIPKTNIMIHVKYTSTEEKKKKMPEGEEKKKGKNCHGVKQSCLNHY